MRALLIHAAVNEDTMTFLIILLMIHSANHKHFNFFLIIEQHLNNEKIIKFVSGSSVLSS